MSKTITDIGRDGAVHIGEIKLLAKPELSSVDNFIAGLQAMSTVKIAVESTDGTAESVEVVPIPLRSQRACELLNKLSLCQTAGYMKDNEGLHHGMLSPNFDHSGKSRKSTIRLHTVFGGFTIINGVWLPEAENATYLAGATSLEGKGVDSDQHAIDPEHKITAYGAVSIGDISIASSHAQHTTRKEGGSVARGLTDGSLGNVFGKKSIEGFSGFAPSREYRPGSGATFYLPKSYIDSPDQAFGAFLIDKSEPEITPERLLTGAALEVNIERRNNPSEFLKTMESSECTN